MVALHIHPRYPSLLASYSTVTRFACFDVIFATFADFIRIVNAFPQLRELYVVRVEFQRFGLDPPCMRLEEATKMEVSQAQGRVRKNSFLPNLTHLLVSYYHSIMSSASLTGVTVANLN